MQIWLELYNDPTQLEKDTLDAVFTAWFTLGRCGGFNAQNMQVTAPLPLSRDSCRPFSWAPPLSACSALVCSPACAGLYAASSTALESAKAATFWRQPVMQKAVQISHSRDLQLSICAMTVGHVPGRCSTKVRAS